jgi:hypothetical protein
MSSRKCNFLRDETQAKKNVASLHYTVEDLMKQPSSTQVKKKIADRAWFFW